MISRSALILAGLFVVNTAFAQDATCAKLTNATHKAVRNCYVSNGGWARHLPDGRVRWGMRGSSGNMALQNCLAKHQS